MPFKQTRDGAMLRTVAQAIADARAQSYKFTARKVEACVDGFLANRRFESGE